MTATTGRARTHAEDRSHNSRNHRKPATHEDHGTDDFLTTEEVAHLCRTSASTVRYWRYDGSGPEGFRVGRRVLYPRSAVDAWLRQRRDEQRPR